MTGLQRLAALIVLSAPLVLASGVQAVNGHANYHAVCPGTVIDSARCHAQVVTDERGNPNATSAPTGLGPQDYWSAYNLPATTAGAGQTIAIVDAFDYPTAENDLNVFSTQYGLPACTTANGCFSKVNQNGGSNLKRYRVNSGWSLEAALDIETAHGICPSCRIVLVEAQTNSFANLSTAEDTAASLANVVSNSYGGSEFSSETSSSFDGHYNHPNHAITVSSGDSGFGAEYPASSQYVTAVGGTTLTRAGNARGWSESAWSGAGSGCSAYEPQPSWQAGFATACSRRGEADVSADADPASGASVYDTTAYGGQTGWFEVGGTSLAAPLVAGVYALAGDSSSASYPVQRAWTSHSTFNDVTSGSNGACGAPLCDAGTGWDGPTGWGTPWGTNGF
jgi:subtilase family serine protease